MTTNDSARDVELAWRDGWASALQAIRVAKGMAEKQRQLTPTEWQAAAIVDDLLCKLVDLIDGCTEEFVVAAREDRFGLPKRGEKS